ncbi:ATP-dependent nuclease [Halobacillus sp. B29]|uniref:ATP-dependent nuclease n=1 Tax=Halobacillus sp. B29 TaxID=3457432 RepID=UPI003FCD2EC2
MRLKKLKLNNFRCFGPGDTIFEPDDMTGIIGSNSSGKTAFMNAVLKMFGDNNNEIKREDFHLCKDQRPEDIEENYFKLEAIFTFPELETDSESYAVPVFFEKFVVPSPGGQPYLRILLEASWKQGTTPDGVVDYNFYYLTVPEGEPLEEEHKRKMRNYDRSHINVLYVPAVREPSSQLRNASGTILWRTLKGVNWKDKDREFIQTKIRGVDQALSEQQGISLIQESIESQWKLYHNQEKYNTAQIKFNNTSMDSILKKIQVQFSPTDTEKSFEVNDLGDGLKSLFYLSMVDSLLQIENVAIKENLDKQKENERILNIKPPALTIILVEEPENHISPHLLGKVMGNLDRLSKRENSQTIITSHSPSLIKRLDPENIRHIRMSNINHQSEINKILLPENTSEAYKYIKEAIKAYPELYFSSLVILGEGDSEEIIIPKIFEHTNHGADFAGISVVPLGGKHVNHFWKLLTQLNIPFITLLDLDRERNGGDWGRIKYILKQLIEIGYSKSDLLSINDEEISAADLEKLHKRTISKSNLSLLEKWLIKLEEYNVFFSNPLDIDFLMLEKYKESYLKIIEANEGPHIKDLGKISSLNQQLKKSSLYKERISHDVRKTLKNEGGNGDTYSPSQQELMIWYSYFFLGRGKPSTHILAMTEIDEEEFFDYLPEVLKRLFGRSLKLIHTDHKSGES